MPGEPSLTSGGGGNSDNIDRTSSRRRRALSPAEHARRVAWGREWGKVMHDHAATIDKTR